MNAGCSCDLPFSPVTIVFSNYCPGPLEDQFLNPIYIPIKVLPIRKGLDYNTHLIWYNLLSLLLLLLLLLLLAEKINDGKLYYVSGV